MTQLNKNNPCKHFRSWLSRFSLEKEALRNQWLYRHINQCDRCRARLQGYSRLQLAMFQIKTQPHGASLFSNANLRVIRRLNQQMRESQAAYDLTHAYPKVSKLSFCSHYIQSIGHCAACLGVVVMVKLGFFGSLNAISDSSEKGLKKYYAKHLPEDVYSDNDFFRL